MSLGTDRVRLSFNPSADTAVRDHVTEIKQMVADIIDLVDDHRGDDPEKNRCIALAQTALEDAAMWAVKAVTTGK